MWVFLIILCNVFVFIPSFSWGQETNIEVQPHFPATANVTDRFLSFRITGAEDIQVIAITITSGDSCVGERDRNPSLADTFHIQCGQPAVVNAEVRFSSAAQDSSTLLVQNLIVLENSDPGIPLQINTFGEKEEEE